MNSRALSAYEAAALGVDVKAGVSPLLTMRQTRKNTAAALQGAGVISETSAPAFQIVKKYLYQSYFDDTLGSKALLAQYPGDPIVASTLQSQQVTGYAVGLHPSSECPVAIRFFTGAQQGASSTYHLVPGQILRPHGRPGDKPGSFSGLEYGLPFGWLGGGSATLVVMRTPDATVNWNHAPEVIFHRVRLTVLAAAAVPISTAVASNWPKRFPWPFATTGANTLTQRGQPAISVSPTKVIVRLRNDQLQTGPSVTRLLFYGTNDFDLDTSGALSGAALTSCGYQDIIWNQDTTIAGSVGVGTTQYQTQLFGDAQLTRLACDEGGAVIPVYNPTGSTTDTTGSYLDFVRYGKL